jgi:hypothetical protein
MLQRPLLFFSSYAPLFGILAIRFERPALVYSCTGLAAAGVAALLAIIWVHSRTNGAEIVIASVNNAGGEAASYLAGYLLPFVTVSQPSARDVVAYIAFIVVAGVVHSRTSAIQVNPLLFLLGWKILQVTTDSGATVFLITREVHFSGDTVLTSRLGGDVRVEQKQTTATAGPR